MIRNLILNGLFLLSGVSLFLFYTNMLYLHIVVVFLMILVLVKSYYQGIKAGLIWFGLGVSPITIHIFKDKILSASELSEILLILAPAVTVGLLADKQRRYVLQLKETYLSTLKTLAEATDARDSYTQGHSERVAKYAVLIAREMLLSESEINYLEQAALLHDIGKLAVPDSILHKKDSLSEDDWIIIRKHPEYSQKILSKLDFLSPILPLVLHHHRRFEEKENSFGEASVNVPLFISILAVADAFDAMTSDRPYRNRLSSEQALEELEKNSGTQFNPEVVGVFKKTFELNKGRRREDV